MKLDAGFPYQAEFARDADRTEEIARGYSARSEDTLHDRLEKLAYESEVQLATEQTQVTIDAHRIADTGAILRPVTRSLAPRVGVYNRS